MLSNPSARVEGVRAIHLGSTAVVSWLPVPLLFEELKEYRVYYSEKSPSVRKRREVEEKEVVVVGFPANVTSGWIGGLKSGGEEYQFQATAVAEVSGETLEGERSEFSMEPSVSIEDVFSSTAENCE